VDFTIEFTPGALAQLQQLPRAHRRRISKAIDVFQRIEGMAALHLYLMEKATPAKPAARLAPYYLLPVGDFVVALKMTRGALVVCLIAGNDTVLPAGGG